MLSRRLHCAPRQDTRLPAANFRQPTCPASSPCVRRRCSDGAVQLRLPLQFHIAGRHMRRQEPLVPPFHCEYPRLARVGRSLARALATAAVPKDCAANLHGPFLTVAVRPPLLRMQEEAYIGPCLDVPGPNFVSEGAPVRLLRCGGRRSRSCRGLNGQALARSHATFSHTYTALLNVCRLSAL